jgi:hypothetical protein
MARGRLLIAPLRSVPIKTGKIVNRCSGTSLTVKGVGLDWQWIKINGAVAIFDFWLQAKSAKPSRFQLKNTS